MPQKEYFIEETLRRLESIEDKLDALHEFKAGMIVRVRLTSLIVSGVCGFISMLACGVLTYLITIKIK